MFNRMSTSEKIFKIINTIIMLFLMAIMIYPMLHVLFASFSAATRLIGHRGLILSPLGFELAAYKLAFRNPMILRGYINTFIVVVGGVAINIALTSLGAYFLSRKNVKLQAWVMKFIVVTMFFNGGLIPFYYTIKGLGIFDTYWALLLPGAVSTFNLIILCTAFKAIPDSLEEAASIDGASHFTIFSRIVFPLSAPTVAVIVLYYAVGHWNAWFNASIFLRTRQLYPLQLILREILIQNDTAVMTQGVGTMNMESISDTVKYAVVIIATAPILGLYPFLQKYFVKGVMIGAVKE